MPYSTQPVQDLAQFRLSRMSRAERWGATPKPCPANRSASSTVALVLLGHEAVTVRLCPSGHARHRILPSLEGYHS